MRLISKGSKARGSAPGPRWGLRPQTPILLLRESGDEALANSRANCASPDSGADIKWGLGPTAPVGVQGAKPLGLLCLALAFPSLAWAQALDLSHGGPVTVTAAGGIDWNQGAQTVTAHDDARAVRGDTT